MNEISGVERDFLPSANPVAFELVVAGFAVEEFRIANGGEHQIQQSTKVIIALDFAVHEVVESGLSVDDNVCFIACIAQFIQITVAECLFKNPNTCFLLVRKLL